MKTIQIRKSSDFSENSKVYLYLGDKKIYLRGYEFYSLDINEGEEFYASQQWTSSNKISYEQVKDKAKYVLYPRLGKRFAFLNLVILMICYLIFYFTKSRWSFFPFIPSIIYIGMYITFLRKRYLIIEQY